MLGSTCAWLKRQVSGAVGMRARLCRSILYRLHGGVDILQSVDPLEKCVNTKGFGAKREVRSVRASAGRCYGKVRKGEVCHTARRGVTRRHPSSPLYSSSHSHTSLPYHS